MVAWTCSCTKILVTLTLSFFSRYALYRTLCYVPYLTPFKSNHKISQAVKTNNKYLKNQIKDPTVYVKPTVKVQHFFSFFFKLESRLVFGANIFEKRKVIEILFY